jgi:uncharacterized repeat protein (TIGR03803 family)
MDSSGRLYGTTVTGGSSGGGTAFRLTFSSGSWHLTTIYQFTAATLTGAFRNVIIDSAGNLYGTTSGDTAHNYGSAFKLAPVGATWTYNTLHNFSGGSDGGTPLSTMLLDGNGNLYGTASVGGSSSDGVIYRIAP